MTKVGYSNFEMALYCQQEIVSDPGNFWQSFFRNLPAIDITVRVNEIFQSIFYMIKELKTLRSGEPACKKRSDGDHLRFAIHRKQEEMMFELIMEMNGVKSWTVPGLPSMDPLDQRQVEEDGYEAGNKAGREPEQTLTDDFLFYWDKGNYIPIDDDGNVLSEFEALESLLQGELKFFLQGKKLVGEFILIKKEKNSWLLMKRHDKFALYHYYSYEMAGE